MFKYRDNKNKLPNHLFYVKDNKGYVMNKLGYANVYSFNKFLKDIINKWNDKNNKDKQYTFIKEQLSWLDLSDTFDGLYSQIMDEYDNEEMDNLEKQLSLTYENKTVFLTAKDRIPLIETIGLIDKNHSKLKEGKFVYVKNINSLNGYLEEVGSQYRIKQFETSRIIDGNKKKFKQAWKLIK